MNVRPIADNKVNFKGRYESNYTMAALSSKNPELVEAALRATEGARRPTLVDGDSNIFKFLGQEAAGLFNLLFSKETQKKAAKVEENLLNIAKASQKLDYIA
ncbi:MAG: hypothetical protein PHV68_07025 [Candidatus Gastranaerophilales bacterium]|nr:hypothetical protein [Candidatus Gastranaerophilales bacterium]